MQEILLGLVNLDQGRIGALPLAGFILLDLYSLVQGFLAVSPWVCTFEAVLLER